MVQNEVTKDYDIVSILKCVNENLSEVESNDSDIKIGDNQESVHKSGTSKREQSDGQAAQVISGWRRVCVLVQRMHNNLYHMAIGDLNPCTMGCWPHFTSGLNGLSVCY
jgi:hypothetical protein